MGTRANKSHDNSITHNYHTPETLSNIFTSVALRQPNDFCPRFQVNKLMKNADAIHLSLEEKKDTCTRLLYDCSETWSKIDHQVDQFVLNFVEMGYRMWEENMQKNFISMK